MVVPLVGFDSTLIVGNGLSLMVFCFAMEMCYLRLMKAKGKNVSCNAGTLAATVAGSAHHHERTYSARRGSERE